MRIATWKEVDELAEKLTDAALKSKIKSGVGRWKGGYTVENAEKASKDLGVEIRDVSKSEKEDCWR